MLIAKLKDNRTLLAILAIAVIGIALYANTWGNQMFWDDDDNIVNNQYVHDFRIDKFFSENLIAGAGLVSNYYRPVLLTVFSLQWQVWGDSVMGYHLVNTASHILAAIALFFLLYKLFKNQLLSFLTALVFLVHPLQTEAVAYVSGLGDPLSALFMILGIILYLRFRDGAQTKTDSWNYIASLGMYALALLTKDSALVMPALIVLADFFYLPAPLTFKEKIKIILRDSWPFFLLLGGYALLRATTLNFSNTFNFYNTSNPLTSSFSARLLTFFSVLSGYFALLFVPANLHFEKDISVQTSLFAQPETILGALLALTLTALALTQIKRNPLVSFGIFWFGIRLFPHSNLLVPTAGLMHEHWLYLPLIGIWSIVIWYIFKRINKKIALSIIAIILVLFSYQTIRRNQDWQDPITFYKQTLEYSPDNYRVTNNLGMAYAEVGEHGSAIETYKRAISLDPDNAVAHHNLGNTYLQISENSKAVNEFETAVRIQPGFIFSYRALANFYLNHSQYLQAREILERSIPYSPNPGETLDLLVTIALKEGNQAKAAEYRLIYPR